MRIMVLVVDDEPRILDCFRDILSDPSLEVLAAVDREEALFILRGRPVDIVVMEPHLLQGDGYLLLATLRQQWETLPVFLMSASWGEGERERAAGLGAVEVWDKPLDVAEARRRILHWARWVAAGRGREESERVSD